MDLLKIFSRDVPPRYRSGLKRSPGKQKIECLILNSLSPQTQTLVLKTGSDNSTAKRPAIGVSVTGPRMTIHYKRISRVTIEVERWRTITAKLPLVPSTGKNYSPSSTMVTSPYAWTILKWYEEPNTNTNLET